MNSNLDERQEQALLQVEHKGCWIAFWGLLAAMAIQMVMYGFDLKAIAGEWIVFMVLSVYLASACLKEGIWDRHFKADPKTNLIVSLFAALVFGGVMLIVYRLRFFADMKIALICAAVSASMVFVLCFAALSIAARSYKKKIQELEKEPEEE